jgi:DNA (cytosine-5)-methyltransferase 1
MKLRVLDLFSGIGGFSLGLERTGGFRVVAFCECEPFPRQVLARHWPGVPIYDDVRTLTGARLAADGIAVDLVCGGFPCQDISVAGRGGGIDGPRSGLWREQIRIVQEVRPRWVVMENVAALLTRGLERLLVALDALGLVGWWGCIPASAVGAHHVRNRLWIVAHAMREGFSASQQAGRPFTPEAFDAEIRAAIAERAGRAAEPGMVRVVHGVPRRVDRIRALGNAVYPAVVEAIGSAILKFEGASVAETPPRWDQAACCSREGCFCQR